MLKRIYIDNYKCFVNFELQVGSINLVLGPNGAGKSTIFEVLRKLQAFLGGDGKVNGLFGYNERCRWQTSLVQTFELDIQGPKGIYKYSLSIEHMEQGSKIRVKSEKLLLEGKPLLEFETGDIQLYRDDYSIGPKYPFDWSLSGVAYISPRHDNKHLTWFKQQIRKFVVAQIIPTTMEEFSDQENPTLSPDSRNFVSWYRYLSQDQGIPVFVQQTLQKVLPSFSNFKFDTYSEQRWLLKTMWSDNEGKHTGYSFSELSDGQRTLIALYTLLQAAKHNGYILCLDEPENYLALPEIRPWIVDLYDLCNNGEVQAILVSHHPEMIDYLMASPVGIWLERSNNLATRSQTIQNEKDGGLSVSELIARGWLHG